MAAPIPPMLKYSIVHNFLNSPPILIKFVSTFMFCKVLYFKAQYALRVRSPLIWKALLMHGERFIAKLLKFGLFIHA